MRFRFADYELDVQRFILRRAGEKLSLRPKVFDLLIHLIRNRSRVVPREELFEVLWGDTVVGQGLLSGLVNERAKSLVNSGALPPSYLAGYSETLLLSPTRKLPHNYPLPKVSRIISYKSRELEANS